jgi:two-component system response regulator YesN
LDDIQAWTQRLFESLLQKMSSNDMGNPHSTYVSATQKYVRQHYKHNISLEQASVNVGITPSYLSRLFKQETGINFTDYLNQVRIEHAQQLIRLGNNKMKQIYKDVGFSTYNYFFKVFKDIVGMTPYTYAKQVEGK